MQTKESQDADRKSGDVSRDPTEEDQPVLRVSWDGLEAVSCIYMICSATDAQQSNASSFIFENPDFNCQPTFICVCRQKGELFTQLHLDGGFWEGRNC